MERSERLLAEGLDRDRADLIIAEGFKKGFGISPVALVAGNVGPHVLGREQDRGMTELLKPPGPVVGGAASFEQNGRRLALGEETPEGRTRQALAFRNLPGLLRDGDLEDGLCKINGDGRSYLDSSLSESRSTKLTLAQRCRRSQRRSPFHHFSGPGWNRGIFSRRQRPPAAERKRWVAWGASRHEHHRVR